MVKNMNVKWKMHLRSSSITNLVSDKDGGLASRGDDTPMSIHGIPWVRMSLVDRRLLEDTNRHNLLQAALLSVLQLTMMVILLASLTTQ